MVIGAALWVLYHKIFNVIYFNAMSGCFKEIVVCFLLGGIIATTIIGLGTKFFPFIIIIAVVIIIVIAINRKNQ